MNATVIAAIIAGGLTLIGTVATQILGRRATRRDIAVQGKQLDKTLAEQRTRTLNERFATAASQLGGDQPPTVQLAGVYAMAVLADDWEKNRQTCVDVLCAYLRMPYEPDPGEGASEDKRRAFRATREVRHTVIRVISAHLKDGAAVSWQGLDFDFTGVVFDGGIFNLANFPNGTVSFAYAEFSGGLPQFLGAMFSGAEVTFDYARFSGGAVLFGGAEFSRGRVHFTCAEFCGGTVSFGGTEDGSIGGAKFCGGTVTFDQAKFSDGHVYFGGDVAGVPGAEFSSGLVSFREAEFSDGRVSFSGVESSADAKFSSAAQVDFSSVADSSVLPEFPWKDLPPPGVKLPEKKDQS